MPGIDLSLKLKRARGPISDDAVGAGADLKLAAPVVEWRDCGDGGTPSLRIGRFTVACRPSLSAADQGGERDSRRCGARGSGRCAARRRSFSGCGTLRSLWRTSCAVHALTAGRQIEGARAAAKAGGASNLTVDARDLFPRPLLAPSFRAFDCVGRSAAIPVRKRKPWLWRIAVQTCFTSPASARVCPRPRIGRWRLSATRVVPAGSVCLVTRTWIVRPLRASALNRMPMWDLDNMRQPWKAESHDDRPALLAAARAVFVLAGRPRRRPSTIGRSGDRGRFARHNGAQSAVFDNARRDLVTALKRMGLRKVNIQQYSARPDLDPRPSRLRSDAPRSTKGFLQLAQSAPAGCFVYITSHGAPWASSSAIRTSPFAASRYHRQFLPRAPDGGDHSACFSGMFIPVLRGPIA